MFTFTRKGILLPALILFACWLPYLIAFAPGTMGWDTTFQIFQYYPNHEPLLAIPWEPTQSYVPNQFTDHHPIFDTLIFSFFAYGSDLLTGSWNAGLTLYLCLQAIAMSLTLSASCAYMRHCNCPRACPVIALVFYAVIPLFPINAATIVKDTLYCWLFLLFLMAICEIVRTRGEVLGRRGFFLSCMVVSLLVCLTKKTGLYIVVPSLIAALCACRSRRLRVASIAAGAIILMQVVLPLVVFPLLDVAPGGRQEVLSIPLQQTALTVVESPSTITDEERQAIDAIVPYNTIAESYDPKSADPVKFTYRWETATTEDVTRYLLTWIRMGFGHPGTYMRALWSIVAPFFDPATRIDVYLLDAVSSDQTAKSEFYSFSEPLRVFLTQFYAQFCALPVIGFLLSDVLYTLVIPVIGFAAVLCSAKGRKEFGVALVPLGLTVLTLFISPVALGRYVYQLVYPAPLLLSFAAKSLAARKPKPSRMR